MGEQARQARAGDTPEDLAASQRQLRWADALVLQFPLWWWSVPAILKGWIDRALSNGFAYGESDLKGRRAMLSLTAETKAERFANSGIAHPLHHLERGTLGFCGYNVVPAFVLAEVYTLTDEARRARLGDLRAHVRRHLMPSDR